MNQKQKVLQRLVTAGSVGVCSTRFLDLHIPRAAARIAELRQDGWLIDTVPCNDPHNTRQIRYVLKGEE